MIFLPAFLDGFPFVSGDVSLPRRKPVGDGIVRLCLSDFFSQPITFAHVQLDRTWLPTKKSSLEEGEEVLQVHFDIRTAPLIGRTHQCAAEK